MDDLISRQAAIDALGEEPEVWSGNDDYEQGLNNQWHYDVNALKALPSAQKKGEWIPEVINIPFCDTETEIILFKCSLCGYREDGESKFCANCGADMRKEVEG